MNRYGGLRTCFLVAEPVQTEPPRAVMQLVGRVSKKGFRKKPLDIPERPYEAPENAIDFDFEIGDSSWL